jgi:putative restriction endonuclease
MAGLRFPKLMEIFTCALERQGASVGYEAPLGDRPARIRVDGQRYVVFLWTITPGGGPPGTRPPNERRIQITKVTGFPLEPDARTIVGGWSEESGVYAFWDARRHAHFSQKSPSLQVDLRTLERAASDGLATQSRPTRQGSEMVVAVHPDSLLWYVQTGTLLHNAPEDADSVESLITATPEEERAFLDSDSTEAVSARRFDLVQVLHRYRCAKFRPAVLRAYSYRCAVCGIALKLVDAAHIIPVAHPGSTDEVTNGLALCKLHHTAYDNALFGVLPDFSVRMHPNAPRLLSEAKLDAGLDKFTSDLPRAIRLPSVTEVRPAPKFLQIGLKARGWPEIS